MWVMNPARPRTTMGPHAPTDRAPGRAAAPPRAAHGAPRTTGRLVAAGPHRLVDGRPVRHRVDVLRRRGDGVAVGIRGAPWDRDHVLRRVDLLHDGRVPAAARGDQRTAR